MFGIGAQEMVIVGLLCLLLFGPGKLSGMARDLGSFVRKARASVDEFKSELEVDGDRDKGSWEGLPKRPEEVWETEPWEVEVETKSPEDGAVGSGSESEKAAEGGGDRCSNSRQDREPTEGTQKEHTAATDAKDANEEPRLETAGA